MASGHAHVWLLVIVAAAMAPGGGFRRAAALEFSLHDSQRCFEEEIHRELLVVGEYSLYVYRQDVSAVLLKLNATESDRQHFGFLKRDEDVDGLISMLEPTKDLISVPEPEQQRQVIEHFRKKDLAFNALHADDERALRDHQRQTEETLTSLSLRELFFGIVHRRIDLPLQLTVTDPSGETVLSKAKRGSGDDTFTFNSKKPGLYRACIRVLNTVEAAANSQQQQQQQPLWPLVDNRGGGVTMGQLAPYLSANGTPMKVKLRWQVGVQSAEWLPSDSSGSGNAQDEAMGAIAEKIFELHNTMHEIEKEMEGYVRLYNMLFGSAERHEAMIKWVGILSCAVVALLSLGQIFFLKLFFKKRKLI